MCGLIGVMLHPTQRSAEEWKQIINIVTSNLVFNEERGREAAGIAVIQTNGHFRIFKQPVPASDLIEMGGYQQALSIVGDNTVCILGHTRAPTKGSRWRNVNNHPLRAGHIIGIHNGIIINDDAVFDQMELTRAGEVDSEVIFRLLDTVNPVQNNGRYSECMKGRIDLLAGTFATLSVDLRRPTGLLVLKKLQPLCVHYQSEWEALFFSSRYIFLRKAFGRSVITEALETHRGFYYDARYLPREGNKPIFSFGIKAEKMG